MTNGEKLRELLVENFPELVTSKGIELNPADDVNICNFIDCSDVGNCSMCKGIGEDWSSKEYIKPEERKNKKFKTRGDKLMDYDSIIFENGQGLCISQDMGDIYTTPSYTGITEPKKIIDEVFKANKLSYDVEACYVSRTYLTRHGVGNLDDEYDEVPEFVRIDTESNIESKYQGKFRYANIKDILLPVTLGDMDLCKYAAPDYKMSIAYTHCDEYFPGIITGINSKTYYVFGPRRGDAVDEFKGINKDITE